MKSKVGIQTHINIVSFNVSSGVANAKIACLSTSSLSKRPTTLPTLAFRLANAELSRDHTTEPTTRCRIRSSAFNHLVWCSISRLPASTPPVVTIRKLMLRIPVSGKLQIFRALSQTTTVTITPQPPPRRTTLSQTFKTTTSTSAMIAESQQLSLARQITTSP
jgi:hypothetical protein